jgi:dolichol-phosphate mannosyltransferase
MNNPKKTLVFIPTYNERGNVANICTQILALDFSTDILFLDDHSPDGTGDVLDELAAKHSNVFVIHREGKLGIGSAHLDGIAWAYAHGYQTLVTMDCDFTHTPADIVKLAASARDCDVVVGSRFLEKDSLPGWSPLRRLLTNAGHLLTLCLLRMPFDASGAFRVYNLDKVPRALFELGLPKGYAFFFESLFVLVRNGFKIKQEPIVLPARTEGASKMTLREMWRGVSRLFAVFILSIAQPGKFKLPPHAK